MDHESDVKAGTGQVELFSVVFSMLASALIHHWFTTRFSYIYFFGGSLALFVIEFVTLCLPPLLIHTFLADHALLATISMLTFSFFLCNSSRKLKALQVSICRDFKVTILVSTCVVIAAVDCKRIFGSQFAKTNLFGFSPMDLGTGLFVAVRGLDLLRRDLRQENFFNTERPKTTPAYSRKNLIDFDDDSFNHPQKQPKSVQSTRRFSLPRFVPLLLIGLTRAMFIEYSGYYQDPTEYGTHWNFFITLALIELFISSLQIVFRNNVAVPIAAFISGLVYFAWLLFDENEQYILGFDTNRNGFFDGNREGIFSTFGYLFILGISYLVGRFFVPSILWDDFSTQQARDPDVLFSLIRNFVVQGVIYLFALYRFGLPSRRSANLVYGLHIHFIVTIIVLFMHIYQHRVGTRTNTASITTQLPTLFSAISRQSGFFFLMANLLTGLLNFYRGSIQSAPMEFASQCLYMLVLCIATQWLDALLTTKSERRLLNKT